MEDFIPGDDAKFTEWLANFNVVLAEHLDEIGLTEADMAACVQAESRMAMALAAVAEAEAAVRNAEAARKAVRASSEIASRALAYYLLSRPEVSPERREEMGLCYERSARKPAPPRPRRAVTVLAKGANPPEAAVLVRPETPGVLEVETQPDGMNILRWNSNGNATGTVYRIEAALGTDVQVGFYRGNALAPQVKRWTQIATTSRTEFIHHSRLFDGANAIYRVQAITGDLQSDYSNAVLVACEGAVLRTGTAALATDLRHSLFGRLLHSGH